MDATVGPPNTALERHLLEGIPLPNREVTGVDQVVEALVQAVFGAMDMRSGLGPAPEDAVHAAPTVVHCIELPRELVGEVGEGVSGAALESVESGHSGLTLERHMARASKLGPLRLGKVVLGLRKLVLEVGERAQHALLALATRVGERLAPG